MKDDDICVFCLFLKIDTMIMMFYGANTVRKSAL